MMPQETDIKMAEFEKRLLHVEASLSALPRVENKLDRIVEIASSLKFLEERQTAYNESLQKIGARFDELKEETASLRRFAESRYAWVRGAVTAATVFWFVLQGAVGYVLSENMKDVKHNSGAIVQLQEQILQTRYGSDIHHN